MVVTDYVVIECYAHATPAASGDDHAAANEKAWQELACAMAPLVFAPASLAFGLYEEGYVLYGMQTGEEVHAEIIFREVVSFVLVIVVTHAAANSHSFGQCIAYLWCDVDVCEIVIEPDAIVKAFFDLPSIFKVSKPLISKLPPPPC